MQRILFATNFDKNAPAIFEYTLLLASKFDATVILFHAFGSGELFTKKQIAEREQKSLTRLKKFAEQHLPKQHQKLNFEFEVDARFADVALPKVVTALAIDMLVLGMKKDSRLLDTLLLGNTTLEISLAIPCAVLVVPEGFFTNQISEIGCTTNFRFRDIALINWLKSISKRFGKNTSLHCLHILQKKQEQERAEKDMEVLLSIFEKQQGIPVHFKIEEGEFIDTLAYFVVSRTIDLLVMNSHQRTSISNILQSSTTRRVSVETKVPLLILKNL